MPLPETVQNTDSNVLFSTGFCTHIFQLYNYAEWRNLLKIELCFTPKLLEDFDQTYLTYYLAFNLTLDSSALFSFTKTQKVELARRNKNSKVSNYNRLFMSFFLYVS